MPGPVRRAALTLLAICGAAPARADSPPAAPREMSTDRPDKTESPYTVDAGRFQIELDVATYTMDRQGQVRTETWSLTPFNLKAGLSPNTDVQLIVEPHVRRTVTDKTTGAARRVSGFGDIVVRVKRNVWGNDGGGTAFALMPFVKLPTNSGAIGNDKVEFGLIAPLSIALGERVGLGLMSEIDIIADEDGGGYAPSFVNSATVAFDLDERLGVYTELFTERGADRGAEWVVTGEGGFTFAVSENVQLDAGANLGLTRAADDLTLFAGLAHRF